MLTKQELSNLVSKLPTMDAYGELIKDVANVYDLMEEAMSDESRDIRNDKISITIGTGTPIEFDLNQSYTDLANEINTTTGLSANIEQVGDGSYRIIIKSTDSGTANALTITPAGTDILDLSNVANHVQTAQNMKAKVDGVDYDVSSNTITVQGGLNITAVAAGISTINIEKDNTAIAPAIQAMVDKYNDLVDIIDSELFSSDSVIEDTSSMRLLLSTVKNQMFGGYGDSGDLRLFNYGLELDKTGKIIVDTKKLGEAVLNNPDELKELFIGKAESKGLGTLLKETLDEMSKPEHIEKMAKDIEDGIQAFVNIRKSY